MDSRRLVVCAAVAAASLLISCANAREESGGNTVKMSVTEKGFEPAKISVEKGRPVSLVITRKTDRTCATEIVIDEFGIHADLPLNQPVTVSFTPTQAGEITYGCGMDKMIGGTLSVR